MAVPKVVTGFSILKDDEVDTVAQTIISKMTGNAAFPTPVPTLASIQAALTAFSVAMADMGKGKGSTVIKDQKKSALIALLNKLGVYVQLNCQDNEALILGAGFNVAKSRTPQGPLSKPEIKVEASGPGQVKVSCKQNGASTYQYEYTLAPSTPDTIWEVLGATKSKAVISGLVSGKQYTFRMVGIGSDPSRVYSDEISTYVL